MISVTWFGLRGLDPESFGQFLLSSLLQALHKLVVAIIPKSVHLVNKCHDFVLTGWVQLKEKWLIDFPSWICLQLTKVSILWRTPGVTTRFSSNSAHNWVSSLMDLIKAVLALVSLSSLFFDSTILCNRRQVRKRTVDCET